MTRNNTMNTTTNIIHRLYKAIKPDAKKNAFRAIDSVHLNSTKAIVTNGHFLIVAPKDGADTLENINLKPIKGNDKFEVESIVSENAFQLIGSNGSIYEKQEGEYLSIEAIYPVKHTGRTIKLGINADYLKRIADAMGKSELVLEFEIPSEENHIRTPIKVSNEKSEVDAVIMPLRV